MPSTLIVNCRIQAPARLIWPYLTQPNLMNQWSTAKVLPVSPGEGDDFATVGTRRDISVPMLFAKLRLREIIEYAEPPYTLVYRVFDSPPIRTHRGEITLEEQEGLTTVRWQVDYSMPFSWMEALSKKTLDKELNKSLSKLTEVMGGL